MAMSYIGRVAVDTDETDYATIWHVLEIRES